MAGNPYLWSTTSATNSNADNDINWVEGQLPSTVNDSARGVMAGVAGWLKDTNGTLTTGGSANAQSVTSNVAYAALATGIRLVLKAGFTNTAACTLNLTPAGGGAFGAKAIKIVTTAGEADPAANNIRADGHYILEYDAAANAAAGAWILLNPSIALVIAVQTFTASGSYTPRTGILYAIMECVGGGGGGGASGAAGVNNVQTGGGGGSGSYSRKLATASTIGASQVVTIGAGGAAASAGADTSVGALCIAKGGSGGGGGGGAGGAGGVAGTGDCVAAGAPGGNGAFFNLDFTSATLINYGGNGGSSVFGGGGKGGVGQPGISFNIGTAGSNYGSGGGGGGSGLIGNNGNGGAGAAGYIIITEYSAA